MKVAALLEERRENWRELEWLCGQMESRGKRKLGPAVVARFGALYRSACADLALAEAYYLPPNTVAYLHQLVGRAHNQLYRSQAFDVSRWAHVMLYEVPQRLYRDNYLRVAFVLFWGLFVSAMALAALSPGFAERAVGKEQIQQMEEMYSEPVSTLSGSGGGNFINQRSGMAGFYIWHNAGIGLRAFALGLVFGVGGLIIISSNALVLGAVFGHMTTVSQREHFFEFVTAHGPFELNAIVLSAAAGMRLGFSLIDTGGLSRAASVRRAGFEALPMMCAAVVLFVLAALIEGFLSPSAAPYGVKAGVAVVSSGLLAFYFVLLGNPRGRVDAA
jgi:uncharacterized membrane protein SpoIIM required for sporulation